MLKFELRIHVGVGHDHRPSCVVFLVFGFSLDAFFFFSGLEGA